MDLHPRGLGKTHDPPERQDPCPGRLTPLRKYVTVIPNGRTSLFHVVVTNGPSSETASDADFDCAWGEKMRIATEEVGPSQGCREFEQLVVFALLRLGENAYGMTIRREIEKRAGRSVSL